MYPLDFPVDREKKKNDFQVPEETPSQAPRGGTRGSCPIGHRHVGV